MSDYDPSSLPAIPDVQLQEPQLTVPGYHPPSLDIVPQLTMPSLEGLGGGSPASMTTAFGHLAPDLEPAAPNYFAPLPAAPANPLQLNGLGPISGAVNPWLANPMGVAEDAERERTMLPATDPGLAAQQHIIHAPTIRF